VKRYRLDKHTASAYIIALKSIEIFTVIYKTLQTRNSPIAVVVMITSTLLALLQAAIIPVNIPKTTEVIVAGKTRITVLIILGIRTSVTGIL